MAVKWRCVRVCILAVMVVCLAAVVSIADQKADTQKAQALYSAKDYNAAIPAYATLIETYPSATDVAEWYYKISSCYFSLKNFDQCFAAHDKAIELTTDPERKQGLEYERALRYESFGRLDTAIKMLDELIRAAPDASGVFYWYFRLGYLYEQKGDYKSAKAVFQYLVDHDPTADWAYKHLAIALIKENKKAEGLAVLDQYCEKKNADHAMCLFIRAEVLFMTVKDYSAVIPVAQEYLCKFPDRKFAEELRGYLVASLAHIGRVDEAIGVLRASITENLTVDQKAEICNRMGDVYCGVKRYRDALIAYRQVRDVKASDETEAYATYHSGLCYAKIGYEDSAQHCMEKVVDTYPNSRWARQAKGAMYVWFTHGFDAQIK